MGTSKSDWKIMVLSLQECERIRTDVESLIHISKTDLKLWDQKEEDLRLKVISYFKDDSKRCRVINHVVVSYREDYTKQKNGIWNTNSWIHYILGQNSDQLSSYDHLKQSMELKNPFAFIDYAHKVEKDSKKKKELYLKAFELGAVEGMVRYIDRKFNDSTVVNILETYDQKKFNAIEYAEYDQKIDSLISKILDKLKLIENAKLKTHLLFIANTYLRLSKLLENHELLQNYFYFKNKAQEVCLHREDRTHLDDFVQEFKLLLEDYNELSQKYQQLKIIRETDFNGIVSSKVAKYLDHPIKN